MEDRRQQKREHLIHYFRILERNTGKEVGNLVNITIEGLNMVRFEPLKIQTPLQLRMDFPEEFEGKRSFEFDGRVIWCRFDTNYDRFAIGLRFSNISEEDKQLLKGLIEFYQDRPVMPSDQEDDEIIG